MQDFYHPLKLAEESGSVPHILGLSASPILRSKLSELRFVWKGLGFSCTDNPGRTIEWNLDSLSITPRLHRQEMLEYVHHPDLIKLVFTPYAEDGLNIPSVALQLLSQVHNHISQLRVDHVSHSRYSTQYPGSYNQPGSLDQLTKFHRKAMHIYEELGAWAADYFILQTIKLVENKYKLSEQACLGLQDQEELTLLRLFREQAS